MAAGSVPIPPGRYSSPWRNSACIECGDCIPAGCVAPRASIDKSETVGRVIVTTSLATVLTEADPQEWARRPVLYEDRYPNETHPD